MGPGLLLKKQSTNVRGLSDWRDFPPSGAIVEWREAHDMGEKRALDCAAEPELPRVMSWPTARAWIPFWNELYR